MNRRMPLVQTDAVGLVRFDHTPGVAHHDPERERAIGHRVNFVEAGSFRIKTTGDWHELSRQWLFVTKPGLEYSCAHVEEHPSDCCLSVSYSDDAVESARSMVPRGVGSGVAGASAMLGDEPWRPLTNRHAFLHRALQTCTNGDEARTEAIAGALLFSLSIDHARQPLFRAERLAWYAARVDRAKAMMEAHYAEPLSLSALAHDAGMSVFHFARIFAELEGRPPHRFLTDVRLTHAKARLRDGASVTDTCYAVGFGSLSHFVTTFRRRYGARPSDIGRRTGYADDSCYSDPSARVTST